MNNKITIKDKNGNYLQHVIFNDQTIQDEWLQMLATNYPFGKPEHTIEVTPRSIDEHGVVTEAVYELIPSEYIVEVLDVTQELLAKKESDEARAYLLATDYLVIKSMESGIPMDESIKALRAAARIKVI